MKTACSCPLDQVYWHFISISIWLGAAAYGKSLDCTLGAVQTSFGCVAQSSEAFGFTCFRASGEATSFTSFKASGEAASCKLQGEAPKPKALELQKAWIVSRTKSGGPSELAGPNIAL